MNGGVSAPSEALIGGEPAGALAFEEENAFAKGIVVVMLSGGRSREEEEVENGGGKE